MSGVKRCPSCKSVTIPREDSTCYDCSPNILIPKGNTIKVGDVTPSNIQYYNHTPPIMTGVKYDNGKPDLSIIPKAALDSCAKALMFGAQKYGRDNFRGGMEWMRLTAAALRHITAFQEGEDLDKESGAHHIGHALACLSMLSYYIETNKGLDNRPKLDNRDATGVD